MVLSLKLFGGFRIQNSSVEDLELRIRKTRALLAYLATHAGDPQPRERLMALLWSDRSTKQARQSLNTALMSIRKLADGEKTSLIDSDRERITLLTDAVDVDVVRFRLLRAREPAEASALYEGAFLDGISVADQAFEEWLIATRYQFHTEVCDALRRAADVAVTEGDLTAAIAVLRRQVGLDPLLEEGHRRLMQLLFEIGDRTAALRQYEICAKILRRELQIEPDALTEQTVAEIKDGRGPPKNTNASADK